MMSFKEFLEAAGQDERGTIQEAILGGPVVSQLAAARQRAKGNDQRLQKALRAHQARPADDDLGRRVARLEEGQEALLASHVHLCREAHLCLEILAALHEAAQRPRGR